MTNMDDYDALMDLVANINDTDYDEFSATDYFDRLQQKHYLQPVTQLTPTQQVENFMRAVFDTCDHTLIALTLDHFMFPPTDPFINELITPDLLEDPNVARVFHDRGYRFSGELLEVLVDTMIEEENSELLTQLKALYPTLDFHAEIDDYLVDLYEDFDSINVSTANFILDSFDNYVPSIKVIESMRQYIQHNPNATYNILETRECIELFVQRRAKFGETS